MDVVGRIKQLQKERGWSGNKLAEKAGLLPSALSNMFSRGTLPSLATLEKLCQAFDMSLAEFFASEATLKDPELKELAEGFQRLNPKEKKAILNLVRALSENEN